VTDKNESKMSMWNGLLVVGLALLPFLLLWWVIGSKHFLRLYAVGSAVMFVLALIHWQQFVITNPDSGVGFHLLALIMSPFIWPVWVELWALRYLMPGFFS